MHLQDFFSDSNDYNNPTHFLHATHYIVPHLLNLPSNSFLFNVWSKIILFNSIINKRIIINLVLSVFFICCFLNKKTYKLCIMCGIL